MKRGIVKRLRWALIALALLPLLLGSGLQLAISFSSQQKQLYDQYQRRANNQAREVRQFFNVVEYDLNLAQRFWNFDRLPVAEQERVLLDIATQNDSFKQITYLGPDGAERVSVSLRKFVAQGEGDWQGRAIVKQVMGSDKMRYGQVRIDPATGEPTIDLAKPMTDLRSGALSGILVASLSLKTAWGVIGRLSQGTQDESFVIDSEQRIIAHLNPSVVLADVKFRPPGAVGLYPNRAGQLALVSSAAIALPGNELVAVVTVPAHVAFQAILIQAAISLLVLLLSVAGAVWLFRKISAWLLQPVAALTEAARRITTGEVEQPIAERFEGEMASLVDAFNLMVRRLHDSATRAQAVLDNVGEGLIAINDVGLIETLNPAAENIFGYSASEIIGRNVSLLMPEPDRGQHDAYLQKYRETGSSTVLGATREVTGVRKNGSHFPLELKTTEVRFEVDRLFIASARDITERKQAQDEILRLNASLEERVQRRTAQLEASNRDLEAFAHSVAHDLRQPFIAIGGFSGLLERTVVDERAKHYIDRIKAGVRQAGELTDALLALANLSRVQLRVQAVDLSAIAHSVMDALQHEDSTRLASLSIQSGLQGQADPMLIRLVLQELLGNAWKFTSRRSHTEISFGLLSAEAGTAGTETIYVVRDNGEGFDMVHADKLFRSFQRLHAPQEFSGVGVGLANVQRIITRHDGKIWAESAVDEGASFYFTLGNARP